MEKGKRMAGIELLRILAMMMVVTLHYITNSYGMIELGTEAGMTQYLGTFLESFSIVAVNVFVLITGYFMVESGFKARKLISFIGQILFYSLLIPLILSFLGIEILGKGQGIYGLIQYILPFSTEHYWFATAYIILYLLIPFLNLGAKQLGKKQFQMALLFLLIAFCGIKSICPIALATDHYGYDAFWFVCLYLTGAYIRLYGVPFLEKRGRSQLLYLLSSAGIFVLTIVLWKMYEKTTAVTYYFGVMNHYNFILCFTGAVGLFLTFLKLDLKEGKGRSFILKIAPFSFGIYLLHEHVDVRYRWYSWLQYLIPVKAQGVCGFLLNWIIMLLVITVLGLLIDYVRTIIFSWIERLFNKNNSQKSQGE